MLYTLGQLGREFPEMRDTLNEALRGQGLQVPARPPSRVMSRGSSRASTRRGDSRGNIGSRGIDDMRNYEYKNDHMTELTYTHVYSYLAECLSIRTYIFF